MEPKDAVIVSLVGDLLVVGRKTPGAVPDIINAIQGEDAVRLYNELTTRKENKEK